MLEATAPWIRQATMAVKNDIRKTQADSMPAPMQEKDFAEVYGIISTHRDRVVDVVNNESTSMLWEVGAYVSLKLSSAAWGDGVVRQLAEYIHTQDPAARGWSYRTIYKMVQFYETYSSDTFATLLKKAGIDTSDDIVPAETAQNTTAIVPFRMAQIPIAFLQRWLPDMRSNWKWAALFNVAW